MIMNLSKLLEIVKDRKAWCAAVLGITESQLQLSDWTTLFYYHQDASAVLKGSDSGTEVVYNIKT